MFNSAEFVDPERSFRGEAATVELAGHPDNPRPHLGDLAEMTQSMRAVGVLQPLVVTTRAAHLAAHPGHEKEIGAARFVIIAGHRRAAAAAAAGVESVPVEVRPELSSDGLDIEVMAIENLQRLDLNPIEEAQLYRRLAGAGRSQRQIAVRVGRAQSHISKRLALLDLPAEVQDDVAAGRLDVSTALALASRSAHARAADVAEPEVRAHGEGGLVHAPGLPGRRHEEEERVELRDRDLCCARLAARFPTANAALRRLADATLALSPSSDAVALAHRWLRGAGIGPDTGDPVEYARIVQGAPARLRMQVAHAIALAADELLLVGSVPWGARQAAHVRRLVKEVGYLPSAEEFRQLAGVEQPAAADAETSLAGAAAAAGDSGGITEGVPCRAR